MCTYVALKYTIWCNGVTMQHKINRETKYPNPFASLYTNTSFILIGVIAIKKSSLKLSWTQTADGFIGQDQ